MEKEREELWQVEVIKLGRKREENEEKKRNKEEKEGKEKEKKIGKY